MTLDIFIQEYFIPLQSKVLVLESKNKSLAEGIFDFFSIFFKDVNILMQKLMFSED